MRRLGFVALSICLIVVLSACAVEGEAAEGSVAVSPIIPTVTPTASPSAEPVFSPTPTPNASYIDIQPQEPAEWIAPDGTRIEAELTHVLLIQGFQGGFRDEYRRLRLKSDKNLRVHYISGIGATLPSSYMARCNITGSGNDLFIKNNTTSSGLEIWDYDLFTINDNLSITYVNDSSKMPMPTIRVNRESTEAHIVLTMECDTKAGKVIEAKVLDFEEDMFEESDHYLSHYYIEEGDSIADLINCDEMFVEDIDGDGIDELRLTFFMGNYPHGYADVHAWMSYDDGEWSIAKLEF